VRTVNFVALMVNPMHILLSCDGDRGSIG